MDFLIRNVSFSFKFLVISSINCHCHFKKEDDNWDVKGIGNLQLMSLLLLWKEYGRDTPHIHRLVLCHYLVSRVVSSLTAPSLKLLCADLVIILPGFVSYMFKVFPLEDVKAKLRERKVKPRQQMCVCVCYGCRMWYMQSEGRRSGKTKAGDGGISSRACISISCSSTRFKSERGYHPGFLVTDLLLLSDRAQRRKESGYNTSFLQLSSITIFKS